VVDNVFLEQVFLTLLMFSLSISFHLYSVLIHSSITDTM
jgi:hypothetical protein